MKTLITIIALAFLATSCQKKSTYVCQTSTKDNIDLNPKTLEMTEAQKIKYIKDNTTEIDGNPSTAIAGEKYTICDKLK